MEVFERLSSVRQEGTAEWIFETDLYRSWLQLTSDASKGQELINYLWVRGMLPGFRTRLSNLLRRHTGHW